MSDISLDHQHGFVWGQVDVSRTSEFQGSKCITVRKSGASRRSKQGVEIYVSPKGQSIRVFKDGRELR